MKDFIKDYGKLSKETGQFYKKHWLGTIIVNVVVGLVMYLIMMPKTIKKGFIDNIKNKFKKKKVES